MKNALVYSTDGNQKYVDCMVNSINSFHANNPKWLARSTDLFILSESPYVALNGINKEAKPHVVSKFMGDYSIVNFRNQGEKDRFTTSAYFRWEIFVNPIFKDYDNILYLDSDTEIGGNLCGLFKPRPIPRISMVEEKMRDWIVQRFCDLKLGDIKHYCNSGVMLVNPSRFNKVELGMVFDALMEEARLRPGRYVDQDSINQIMVKPQFARYLEVLPGEYNYFDFTKDNATKGAETKILHYAGRNANYPKKYLQLGK